MFEKKHVFISFRFEQKKGSSSTALLPWLALFPLGFVAAVVIGWLWLWGATQEEALVPGFRGAVLMTLLANLVSTLGRLSVRLCFICLLIDC